MEVGPRQESVDVMEDMTWNTCEASRQVGEEILNDG